MYTTQLTKEVTTNISHKMPYSESPSCLIYLLVYCLLVIEQCCYQQHIDRFLVFFYINLFLKVVRKSLFCLAISALNAATEEDSRVYKIVSCKEI